MKTKEYSTVFSYHVLVTVSAASEKKAEPIFREIWDELAGSFPSKKGYITLIGQTQEITKQMTHQDAEKELDERWEDTTRSAVW